jgi:hypothetical protein
MVRYSLHLLALAAVTAFAAGGEAAAGSCCACPAPCDTDQVVEIVAAHRPAPFYVVDQGPIYAGPGIVSFPTTFKHHQSIGAYPYIGHGYGGYRQPRSEVVLWQQSRVVYIDVKAPHRMVMSGGHRVINRGIQRRMVRPPLDPRDK